MILFRTASDIAGSAVISQLSAGRKNRLWLEVDGMHQSAVFDQEQPEQLWIGSEAGAEILYAIQRRARRAAAPALYCPPATPRVTPSALRTTSLIPTLPWMPTPAIDSSES